MKPATPHTNRAATPLRCAILACATAGLLAAAGCDDSPQQPQSASLRDDPQTTLGRTAGAARDVRRQAEQRQDHIAGYAGEVAGDHTRLQIAGLAWSIPPGWLQQQPTSQMREAEYRIDTPAGTVEVVFFYFGDGGRGGSVDDNIDRWANMVRDDFGNPYHPRPMRRTVSGVPVTKVKMEGAYMDGMPGGPQTPRHDYGFLGAIAEGPQGNVFIRLTGPRQAVNAVEDQWSRMVLGMSAD